MEERKCVVVGIVDRRIGDDGDAGQRMLGISETVASWDFS